MIEIRRPYLVQPEPEEPEVRQVPGTSMITVTAPMAITESTEPTYTMDEEGTIKGKGIAIHPSYYERKGLHPYVQKRIARDLITEYERSKIPSTVQRMPYRSLEEYQIDLVRTIASPMVSQEEKTQARLELMRIDRYRERGYKVKLSHEGFIFYREEPEPFDVLQWQEQRHKDIGAISLVTGGVARFMAGYADPETIYHQWTAPIGTDPRLPREKAAWWEYYATKYVEGRDYVELSKHIAFSSPIFTNILFPFGIGAAASKVIPVIISPIQKYLTGVGIKASLAGKLFKGAIATTTSKLLPIVPIAPIVAWEGMRIKSEFDESAYKGRVALAESILRFTSAYVGAKWATQPKPIRESRFGIKLGREMTIVTDAKGYKYDIYASKYFRFLGKKWWYSHQSMTAIKAPIKPKPSYDAWGMKTPPGLDHPLFTGYRPVGATTIQKAFYDGKVFFDTGKGWQMKTGIPIPGVYTPYQPSILVYPKLVKIPKGPIIPYEPKLSIFAKTESMKYLSRIIPKTGLVKHPSEIKNLDELFKTYQDHRITRLEYETQRNILQDAMKELDKKPDELIPSRFKNKPFPKRKPIGTEYKITPSTMEWKGKVWYRDSKGWQMKTGIPKAGEYTGKQPWTTVYPHPKVYRSYEHHFIFIVYDFNQFFGVKVKPSLGIKGLGKGQQPKVFEAKDIFKTDTDIGKMPGTQVQRDGTITIQEVKTTLKDMEQNIIIEPEKVQVQTTKTRNYLETMLQQKPYEVELPTTKSKTIITNIMDTQEKQSTRMFERQEQLSRLETKPTTIQRELYGYFPISISASAIASKNIYDTVTKQFNKILYPKTKPIEKILYEPPPIHIKTGEGKIKIKKLPGDELIKEVMPGLDPNQAYNVLVKPRTYVSGKRIRPDSYEIKLNKKPLSHKDAMSLGAYHIEHNEKASFVVVPVEGKPTKLRRKIPSYFSHSQDFVLNKKGQIVEIPSSRIDTPGEIEAITMRGVSARKNKSSREERTMNSINKKVERTIKSMVRKAGGIF